jgi:hypothetical protein
LESIGNPLFFETYINYIGGDETMVNWLRSLRTNTPQEGFELAITLSQKGVEYTQPSVEIRERLRPRYSRDADSLIAASQVIAINFQTIAAANNYWKDNNHYY